LSNELSGQGPTGRALIVYDTLFGNTKKIAEEMQLGLNDIGIETECVNARNTSLEALKEFDLIIVGAPTQVFSASKPMKEFLKRLENIDLHGKFGFAFDTKLDSIVSGSAAKYIQKELMIKGVQIVMPYESALVVGNTKHAELQEHQEERFRQIGLKVGGAFLLTRRKMIPA
jgi:flavodoxin